MRIGTTLRLATAPTIPHTFSPLFALGRPLPPRDADLLRPGERELSGRRILRQRRAGSQGRAAADADRRHQLRVRTDEHVVLDDRAVLVRPVVIAHDGPRTDVHVPAHLAVADVAEVVGLGALADAARLDLDEIADVDLRCELRARPRPRARVRPDAAFRADVGVF